MAMPHYPLALAGAAILLTGCHRQISGRYIGQDPNGVYCLQLVKTPDSRLTGQLEGVALEPDGSVEHKSVNLSGAVDGNNIVLSAITLGVQVITLSGNLDGNRLTLTGAQSGPITLVRSDIKEYNREVGALNARSQRILAEKATAADRQRVALNHENFVREIDRLVHQMETFDSEAEVQRSKFPTAEERYHAITARMNEYVNRERQLAGNPNAGVARGQLVVAANQTSLATEELHNSVESFRSSLESNVQPVGVEAASIEQACRNPNAPSYLTPTQVEESRAACDRLFRADGRYRQEFDAMTRVLVRLEQVYAEERNTQEGLLQTAQRLQ